MTRTTLPKPPDHSMAHHLVTYAANNMIAPLVHAQIARDEYEDLRTRLIEAAALVWRYERSMVGGKLSADARAFLARYDEWRRG